MNKIILRESLHKPTSYIFKGFLSVLPLCPAPLSSTPAYMQQLRVKFNEGTLSQTTPWLQQTLPSATGRLLTISQREMRPQNQTPSCYQPNTWQILIPELWSQLCGCLAMWLQATTRPKLKKMKSQTGQVGEKQSLKCEAAAGNPQPSYRWFKDGKELNRSRDIRIKYGNGRKNSRLQFNKVKVEDAGEYVCEAENILGKDTVRGRLYVNSEAEELYQKRVLTITGICVALLVVGIVCVVAYCKTKKQRKQMHNHLRQNMCPAHQNRSLANGPSHPRLDPEEIQMADYISKNVPATDHVIRRETETTFSGSHSCSPSHHCSTATPTSSHRHESHTWSLERSESLTSDSQSGIMLSSVGTSKCNSPACVEARARRAAAYNLEERRRATVPPYHDSVDSLRDSPHSERSVPTPWPMPSPLSQRAGTTGPRLTLRRARAARDSMSLSSGSGGGSASASDDDADDADGALAAESTPFLGLRAAHDALRSDSPPLCPAADSRTYYSLDSHSTRASSRHSRGPPPRAKQDSAPL
uniref:Neuregulin 2 n=1 Tax=Rhinopithecus roxellana TaxID=61622 RepID=A0A2K6QMR9_RHIRO